MINIRVVTPITTAGFSTAEGFREYVDPTTNLSQKTIEHGPASIENEFDEMLAIPDTVAKIIEAERDGVDAVVIDCMGDPGLKAGREAVAIPVLGPCETSMHIAAMLGQKFSIVTVLESCVPMFQNTAAVSGLASKLASVRWVDIPVLGLKGDHGPIIDALIEQSLQAIRDEGAHVIIFGCTGMKGCAEGVAKGLSIKGYGGVPVIDPMPVTIRMAEAFVKSGLHQSKRTYMNPYHKPIAGYTFMPSLANNSIAR